jgi:hypothetical protein
LNVFSLSKTIDAPLDYVYRWCTDFAAVQRAVPTAPRRIVQATKSRVVYVELYEGADSQRRVGVDIVSLKPPNSWHMEYVGEDNEEIAEYRLKKLGERRTRIDIRFRNKWKGSLSLSTEEKQKIENDVWDKYIAAIEKDFKQRR